MVRIFLILFFCIGKFSVAQLPHEIAVDLSSGEKKYNLEFTKEELAEKSKLLLQNSKNGIYRWQVTITEKKKVKVEKQMGKNAMEVPVTHQKHLKRGEKMIFEFYFMNEKTKFEVIFCTVTINLK
ncbi:MAG: hypothetical protein IAF38_20825 [Bacteroidia bacterium]|nr:hypothetical protein [Bacteroidia bacterium]